MEHQPADSMGNLEQVSGKSEFLPSFAHLVAPDGKPQMYYGQIMSKQERFACDQFRESWREEIVDKNPPSLQTKIWDWPLWVRFLQHASEMQLYQHGFYE